MYPKSQQSQNDLTSMSTIFLKIEYRHNILQCCDWGIQVLIVTTTKQCFDLYVNVKLVLNYSHYFLML